VAIKQRVGATVLEPSTSKLLNAEQFSLAIQSHQTDELLEFRKIMEVALAGLAAEKAAESDIRAMRAALDQYKAEMATNRVDCNTDMSFHTALAAASKNRVAVMVWQMLSTRLAEVLARTMTMPHICDETLRDHETIYRAVKSRNPRRARKAMRAHLENADRNWRITLRGNGSAHSGIPKRTKAETPVAIPR
jgi:GntR family transcriptional repressor for pyruvate dehydrogenase complex